MVSGALLSPECSGKSVSVRRRCESRDSSPQRWQGPDGRLAVGPFAALADGGVRACPNGTSAKRAVDADGLAAAAEVREDKARQRGEPCSVGAAGVPGYRRSVESCAEAAVLRAMGRLVAFEFAGAGLPDGADRRWSSGAAGRRSRRRGERSRDSPRAAGLLASLLPWTCLLATSCQAGVPPCAARAGWVTASLETAARDAIPGLGDVAGAHLLWHDIAMRRFVFAVRWAHDAEVDDAAGGGGHASFLLVDDGGGICGEWDGWVGDVGHGCVVGVRDGRLWRWCDGGPPGPLRFDPAWADGSWPDALGMGYNAVPGTGLLAASLAYTSSGEGRILFVDVPSSTLVYSWSLPGLVTHVYWCSGVRQRCPNHGWSVPDGELCAEGIVTVEGWRQCVSSGGMSGDAPRLIVANREGAALGPWMAEGEGLWPIPPRDGIPYWSACAGERFLEKLDLAGAGVVDSWTGNAGGRGVSYADREADGMLQSCASRGCDAKWLPVWGCADVEREVTRVAVVDCQGGTQYVVVDGGTGARAVKFEDGVGPLDGGAVVVAAGGGCVGVALRDGDGMQAEDRADVSCAWADMRRRPWECGSAPPAEVSGRGLLLDTIGGRVTMVDGFIGAVGEGCRAVVSTGTTWSDTLWVAEAPSTWWLVQ